MRVHACPCASTRVCVCRGAGDGDEPPAQRGSAHGFVRPSPRQRGAGSGGQGCPSPPAPLPPQSSARSRVGTASGSPGIPRRLPQPRGKPPHLWPARRGGGRAAATCAPRALAAARTSCGAARAGKDLHPLRLQNKSSGACAGALCSARCTAQPLLRTQSLGVFLSSAGYLPAFVLSPRCGAALRRRGKLLEGGRRGLVAITSALPPPPLL